MPSMVRIEPQVVLESAGFRDAEGRFDPQAFEDFVTYQYGSQRNFVVDQRMNMLAAKMARLAEQNAEVTEAEARSTLLQRLEEVQLAWVALSSTAQEARTLYHHRGAIYAVPEQVRARHILLQIPPDADEATVAATEARAQALLERIRGGEDFAAIALEVSDDPGSKQNGGDLGFFGRGQMVEPFEDVAFELEPGALSDLVRSDFGIHIIRVEEHRDASNTPFEEVREELARELVASEAKSEVNRALAEKLAAAIRDGQSLESAARAEGLTLERSGWLRRRPDGFVPGLGAAFALEPGQSSDRIF